MKLLPGGRGFWKKTSAPTRIEMVNTRAGEGIWGTCPHCGERVEGVDLAFDTDPPDGIVRWYPSLFKP